MENYLGEIRLFAGNYAPYNWHMCDGALLTVAGNEALFTLIGTTYGGDGVSNFQLPDLRGRVPLSKGVSSASGTNYPLGLKVGVEAVTLTQANLPQHTHSLSVSVEQGDSNAPAGNCIAVGTSTGYKAYNEPDVVTLNPQAIGGSSGGNAAHENMMPYICINYIIALVGIYPSQS